MRNSRGCAHRHFGRKNSFNCRNGSIRCATKFLLISLEGGKGRGDCPIRAGSQREINLLAWGLSLALVFFFPFDANVIIFVDIILVIASVRNASATRSSLSSFAFPVPFRLARL